MNRLRLKDGFKTFDRYIRYLSKMLKRHKVQHFGADLLEDARKGLKDDYDRWEEAKETYSDANDDLYIVESEAEDEVRNTHDMVRTADRRDSSLGLADRIFPDKLAPELAPRGRAQAAKLRELATRIDDRVKAGKLSPSHEVAAQAKKLRAFADELDALENERDRLAVRVAEFSAKIRLTKNRILEQVEGTYGALRTHYASRPRFVSRFFRPRTGKRSKSTTAEIDTMPELPEATASATIEAEAASIERAG